MNDRRGRALVLEDEDADFEQIASGLRNLGLQVQREQSGEEVSRRAAEEKPDLIVLDVWLGPEPIGWLVCRRLKTHAELEVRRIPVLIVTRDDNPGRSFAVGADDYLWKERLSELEARAEALLRRSRPSPYGAAAGERTVSITAREGHRMDMTVGVVEFRVQSRAELDIRTAELVLRGREVFRARDWRPQAAAIGRELYERIFEKHSELLTHVSRLTGEPGPMRLRFSGPRDALAVPLELLFNPDDEDGTHFVLRHPLARSVWGIRLRRPPLGRSLLNDLWSRNAPLEILLVASNTSGPVNYAGSVVQLLSIPAVDAEIEALEEGLRESFAARGIKTRIHPLPTRKASYDAVKQALQEPYHMIHYAGHADYREDAPEASALFFWEKDGCVGPVRPMPVPELWNLLEERGPSFVYLSCCRSGDAGTSAHLVDNDFLGLLDGLVKAGVPSALGFRWPVSDLSAMTMAKAFYAALAETGQCDSALLAARRAVAQDRKDRTWLSPVLVIQG